MIFIAKHYIQWDLIFMCHQELLYMYILKFALRKEGITVQVHAGQDYVPLSDGPTKNSFVD